MSKRARQKNRSRGDKLGFRRESGRTPKSLVRKLRDRLAEPETVRAYEPDELPVDEPLWGNRARYVAQQLRNYRPVQ